VTVYRLIHGHFVKIPTLSSVKNREKGFNLPPFLHKLGGMAFPIPLRSFLVSMLTAGLLMPVSAGWAKPSSAAREGAKTRREIVKRLRHRKFSPSFVRFLGKNFQESDHERVLRLNILGFLHPVDHHVLVTPEAVTASKEFLKENPEAFKKAKTLFGVDPEVISALLWVETRHGSVMGKFSVPSVYASLSVANTKRSRRYLVKEATQDRLPASLTLKEVKKKIRARTAKKTKWAIGELRILEKIFLAKRQDLGKLEGSFAGAFGIPQFVPSSYQRLAFTARPHARPDLNQASDAILSVANYLKKKGWGKDSKSKRKAIYQYNHSSDYVDAILELSRILKEKA
jgi:membrane-bound lytic murein transglycosylase B